MLSQQSVDCAIKAYALNSPELCRQVRNAERELRKLQLCIGDRGRTLLAAGTPVDSHSPVACCSLRIYSSLRVMFTAATEITQNVMVVVERGREVESPQTAEVGKFVNGLVRLCSVAIFEEEMSHAKAALRLEGGRRRFNLALNRAQHDLLRNSGAGYRCEWAIANCIGQIAEQSYELAESIILWLEGTTCISSARVRAAAHVV